jgi:hypothetical protein
MRLKMSFDGIQYVEVDIAGAINKAMKSDDDHNLRMLTEILRIAKKRNKITKGDYDFVNEYLRGYK